MTGYEKLVEAVKKDCNELNHCGCFNPEGCNTPHARIGVYGDPDYKQCFHHYCDKFKWIIDRAKHYADKTGLPWEQILNSWEERRDYWYMNYYQDYNQPKIESENVRVFDSVQDFREAVKDRRFRCPRCKGISTNPYECNAGGCDWKIYGLLPSSPSAYVFCKDVMAGERIFMPIAWET